MLKPTFPTVFTDLRAWTARRGLIALYQTTETHSLDPVVSATARPVLIAAPLTLLVSALRERLARDRRATAVAVANPTK